MRFYYLKETLKSAVLVMTVLLATAGVSSAQTVNLTASQQAATTPDGNITPMWGWTCGQVTQGTTAGATTGTSCTALTYNTSAASPTLNAQAAAVTTGYAPGGGAWQPPLIIIPYTGTPATATSGPVSTTSLTINLTNVLPVETSIMILGQVGGGLGAASTTAPGGSGPGGLAGPVREPSGPRSDGAHAGQTATTWTTVVGATFNPPSQSARIRSMVPEVSGVTTLAATSAAGTAANTGTYTWTGLKPGTYLIRTGTYPSIQGPMGLYGVLVVTQAPTTTAAGTAYPSATTNTTGAVMYDADVVALESEIDPRQNNMVAAAFSAATSGTACSTTVTTGCVTVGANNSTTLAATFSEVAKWNLQCGAGPNGLTPAGTPPTCYPPAVDYTPLYFLFNGVAFNKNNQALSALPVAVPSGTGNVLVRFVNAGSHMHIPSANGLNMLLVAEDANVLPDVALALGAATPKALSANPVASPACTETTTPACGLNLRTEVFQPAGKVMDVIVSPGTATATYMIYDRALEALTTNNSRDGGMQAVLDVADPGAAALAGLNAAWAPTKPANAAYTCVPGVTLQITDAGKGVAATGVNIYGVTLLNGAVAAANNTVTPFGSGATTDSLTLNPDGTFVYRQAAANTACGGTFTYYVNNNTTLTASATITQASPAATVVANPDTYNSQGGTILRVGAPGVLGNDYDSLGYPLCAAATAAGTGLPTHCPSAAQTIAASNGVTISLFADGSFTAVTPGTATAALVSTFQYVAANSQGAASGPTTVTLNFPAPSKLVVTVQDAPCVTAAGSNATALAGCAITDYKWIIEQDLTFPINPACQVNTGTGARPTGCAAGLPPTPATNFHTSYMPVIAEGCTGPQSCSRGQTVYDPAPKCTTPGVPAGCSATGGEHVAAACDGSGNCTIGAPQLPASMPSSASLTATNPDGSPASYYISILSGDSQNAFAYGNVSDPSQAGNCTVPAGTTEPTGMTTTSKCGHTMGGAPIPIPSTCTANPCTFAPVTVNLQRNPLPTATVTAFVFEDDYPLNGEPDAGGGIDVVASNEPGLGDFQIEIWDTAGGIGDNTGQMTYDMFNMPLTNALNGTIDPSSGLDACPISNTGGVAVGAIIVCPKFESDGKTLSPLTGQAVVRNLMQGKFTLIAHPGAAREAAGEEWLQTNSLDGGHFLDSFIRPGEPPYFQEFGPAGYHVFFGMANPKIINARVAAICTGTSTLGAPFTLPCNNNVNGQVTNLHQSRTPNESLYSGGVLGQGNAGNYAPLSYTNCYAALGDSDGATIAFAKCDPDGNFKFTNLPAGNYGIVIFDQWNDFIVDGSSRPVNLPDPVTKSNTVNVVFPTFTWQAHVWSRIYMDTVGEGRPRLLADGSLDPAFSPGLIQVPTRIRHVNGKIVNTLLSDIGGNMRFDETFPLFAFYTVESDNTRFRTTGIHVVNDDGGQVDGPAPGGNGNTGPYQGILNSKERFSLPSDLSVPGALYCGSNDAACLAGSSNLVSTPRGNTSCGTPTQTTPCQSTGRIDPGSFDAEGWQGGVSEFEMIDWGKQPYYMAPGATVGENGGIRGRVVNNTTRNFDDIRMQIQNLWEPLVPRVQINLYQEGFATDGVTPILKLVDTTTTASFDDWAQGFHAPAGSAPGTAATIPNMSCTGQDPHDPFFTYTLQNTPNYLTPGTTVPHNSQYKCYDGYHNLNQLQPAPYDGQFKFPSQECLTGATFHLAPRATTGQTAACVTIANPAFGVAGQTGAAAKILPPGIYVAEVVLPQGWQLDKEEDLNLLIGDQYIAPATNQFTGLGAIFITPDQASINAGNPSYTGPYTGAAGVNGTSGSYTPPWTCTGTPGTATYSCTLTPSTTNNGKQSTDYGRTTFGVFAPGGLQLQSAQCVGRMRIVPDYLSISPESGEVSPFAGSLRPLCDRKEITLSNQMQADLEFNIYTNTPKTTSFTGFISDDFSSEFDPAAPAFGEKFAVPNVPVSIRDFNGQEISRVYSDQWGVYNGLVYSTWEVDPPNITGFSPNMMVTCMNDPGPIPDPNNPGQTMNDPYYNPQYSTFCYENPFMPGDTTYLDTPVIPVSAFAEGYNPPDCAYPDGTPAIKSVIGSDGVAGPWVSAPGAGHTLTITALGPQPVPNNAYSGPAANTTPYNLKFITRNYNFGATAGTVTIGGVPATVSAWGPTSLTVQVPVIPAANSTCQIQQLNTPAGTTAALCGELVITTAPSPAFPRGQQSIDTITVTYGGKRPTVLPTGTTIQSAIDAAAPGDMIIVPAGTYNELLLMWKPVRLQGVGAASSIVNGNTHPAGKLLEPWRRQVNCLFGLAINGQPNNPGGPITFPPTSAGAIPPINHNPYDPTGATSCPGTGWNSFAGGANNPQVDRLPLEGIVGWDTTVNGNLAELLLEPSLMGAYEGAAITVLGKGVRFPTGANVFGIGPDTPAGSFVAHESQMPVPTIELTNSVADCHDYPSNFQCNPSSIDGLGITNSSQGGGGIFVHAWGHNLQIANNRIYSNGGTLAGGITVGMGESGDALLSGNGGNPVGYNGGTLAGFDQQPWTCLPGAVVATTATPYGYDQVVAPPGTFPGQQLPYCYNLNVNVHNNAVTSNISYGDELFSATPGAGGGVAFCNGSDYYDFDYNWVCGNLSTGDGGGLAHLGFSWNGDISHNSFLFNQSFNPTLPTHGGGVVVLGAAPDGAPLNAAAGTECGSTSDADCAPGLSDGTGPGLKINANLFQGNTAESGSGGGLEFEHVNGTDVQRFPSNPAAWYEVSVTNNIFANNVAGWTGGGISLHDAVRVNIINNTVVSNDTTASAGVLFDSLGAPNASQPPNGCNPVSNPTCSGFLVTTSTPQPAGLSTESHTANFLAAFTNPSVTCPAGHEQCTTFSNPILHNNLFWQNRAFHIAPDATTGTVQLHPALTQTATGACPTTGPLGESTLYWDIGVYNDTAPNNHASGLTLHPDWSILTNAGDYPAGHNIGSNPNVVSQYCDGSRVPPEIAPVLCGGANGHANAPGCIQPGTVGLGITVPGGVPDSLSPPLPLFTLTPAATVDEGNNWINMFYGPLSLTNPTILSGSTGYVVPLGNYSITPGSPAENAIPSSSPTFAIAPTTDFFGNRRPDPSNQSAIDIGAIELQPGNGGAIGPNAQVSPTALNFGNQLAGTTSPLPGLLITITNTGTAPLNPLFSPLVFSNTAFVRNTTGVSNNCNGAIQPSAFCNIAVRFVAPATVGLQQGTLTIATNDLNHPTLLVSLSGTSAQFTVAPASLNLNYSSLAARSGTVTVSNYGSTAVAMSAPTVAELNNTVNFAVTGNTCGTSLAPGTSAAPTNCFITVQLTGSTPPSTNGTYQAALLVNDAYFTSPQRVSLSGTDQAVVSFSGPTPALTTAPANTSAKSGTITVTNTGTGPLVLSAAPTITTTSSFTIISGGTCANNVTVAPGGTCTITVQYNPNGSTSTSTAFVTLTDVGAAATTQNSPNFSGN